MKSPTDPICHKSPDLSTKPDLSTLFREKKMWQIGGSTVYIYINFSRYKSDSFSPSDKKITCSSDQIASIPFLITNMFSYLFALCSKKIIFHYFTYLLKYLTAAVILIDWEKKLISPTSVREYVLINLIVKIFLNDFYWQF